MGEVGRFSLGGWCVGRGGSLGEVGTGVGFCYAWVSWGWEGGRGTDRRNWSDEGMAYVRLEFSFLLDFWYGYGIDTWLLV